MEKPVPRPSAYTQHFWDGCRERELRYQRCTACGTVQLIPRTVCTQCHGSDLQWHRSAGRGVILSYTNVYRAPTAAFKADLPYVIALIDMDEGWRLMSHVRGGPTPAVTVGTRVRIDFMPQGESVIPIAELEAS